MTNFIATFENDKGDKITKTIAAENVVKGLMEGVHMSRTELKGYLLMHIEREEQ